MRVKRTRVNLSNGLPVVVIEVPGSYSVSSTFWVKAGTRVNPEGKEGLAHLVEHLLLEKTKKYPSNLELAQVLENVGAWKNAWTNRDHMEFLIHSSKDDFPLAIGVLGEIIQRPLIDSQAMDTERGIIEKEILRKEANPEVLVWDKMFEIFFRGSPLGVSTLGTKESLKGITLQDTQDFWKKNFLVNNSLLCIAGPVETKRVAEEVEKVFSSLRRVGKDWILPSFEYNTSRRIIIEKRDLEQVTAKIAFRTGPGSTDIYELGLIRAVLCSGWSSRLVQRLRIKESLIYNWGCSRLRLWDTGSISFMFSTSLENLKKLLSIFTEEIVRFRDGGVTEDELKLAKGFVVGSLLSGMETPHHWVNWYAYEELFWPEDVESLEEYIAEIKTIKAEDIQKVAKKYFTKTNWYLALVGDVSSQEGNDIELEL